MTILAEIKSRQLIARKNRDPIDTALLTTFVGEATMPGKSTEDVAIIALLKKYIKNAEEVVKHNEMLDNVVACQNAAVARHEISVLESFLPKQMTEAELRATIIGYVRVDGKDMGDTMKALKMNHGGTYDGAMASKILKEILAK